MAIIRVHLVARRFVEGEEIGHGDFQPFGDAVKGLKRGRVPTTFDQAQKVHGNIQGLSETLLSHPALRSNLPQALPESLS